MFHKKSLKISHKRVVDDTLLAEIIHPNHQENDPNLPFSLAHVKLSSGKKSTPHKLIHSTETYIIIQGHGQITIGDETEKVHAGSVVVVAPNKIQSIQNTGYSTLLFYCIVSPPWDQKQDISCNEMRNSK